MSHECEMVQNAFFNNTFRALICCIDSSKFIKHGQTFLNKPTLTI